MNRPILLTLILLLGACNVKNPTDGDDNVSIHADDSGNIAFNLPIAEGKIKVPASVMHEGDIDIDGVKLMPGSSVTGFNLNARDETTTVNIGFTAPASPDQVRSYFVDQFRKKGVEAAIAGDSVTGKSKDGSPFKIDVAAAPKGATGTIVLHSTD